MMVMKLVNHDKIYIQTTLAINGWETAVLIERVCNFYKSRRLVFVHVQLSVSAQ